MHSDKKWTKTPVRDQTVTTVPNSLRIEKVPLPITSKELLLSEKVRAQFKVLRDRIRRNQSGESRYRFKHQMKILFVGQERTEKSLAASILAKELGLDVYRIGLSQVVSKYIGETEKKLKELLDRTNCSESILFLDDADALFGKRSQVEGDRDRNGKDLLANVICQFENRCGLLIFSTRYQEGLDEAFLNQIESIINFPARGEEGQSLRIPCPTLHVEEIQSPIFSISGAPTSITAFVGRAIKGPIDLPAEVLSFHDFEHTFGGLSNDHPMSFAVRDYFLNGGYKALVVRVGANRDGSAQEMITDQELIGKSGERTGLFSLERTDLFNLLCIPPLSPRRIVSKNVITTAASYCESRRAFLIVDCPGAWNSPGMAATEMKDPLWSLGTQSRNAAVFFPRIVQPNPLKNGRHQVFAPCGAVAGVIARTDAMRGVWKAPAGIEAELKGVTGLSIALTDVELGGINALGCNCLKALSPAGPVVQWGARTLSKEADWRYIQVRRLALFLEESIDQGTRWTVSETKDEQLRDKLRQAIEVFLMSLFRSGAFPGKRPEEAFFVRYGQDTSTADGMNCNLTNLLIGFAPLKPNEFMCIRVQLRAQ